MLLSTVSLFIVLVTRIQPDDRGNESGPVLPGSRRIWTEAQQHYEAGLALKQAGKYSKAVSELQKAIRLQRDYVDAHWALAWTYVAQGRKDAAIVEFHVVAWFAGESEQGKEARAAIGRLGSRVPPFLVGATQPETNQPVVITAGDRRWSLHYCVTQFFPDIPTEFAAMSPTVWFSAENVIACVYSNGSAFLFDLKGSKYTQGLAIDRQGRIVDAAGIMTGASEFCLPPLALDFPVTPSVRSRVDEKGVFLVPQSKPPFSREEIDANWKVIFSVSSGKMYNGICFPQDEIWLFDRERQLLALVYPSLLLPGRSGPVCFAQGFDLRAARALCGYSGAAWASRQAYQKWKQQEAKKTMGTQGLFWFGISLYACFIIVSLRIYFRTGLKAELWFVLSGLLLIPTWILHYLGAPAGIYRVLGVSGLVVFSIYRVHSQ
jgi:tetratricopeptide (TPR) repeat protein